MARNDDLAEHQTSTATGFGAVPGFWVVTGGNQFVDRSMCEVHRTSLGADDLLGSSRAAFSLPRIVIVAAGCSGDQRTSTTQPAAAKSSPSQAAVEVAPSIEQMLAEIRVSFGLKMSQLAATLRVERPTVYAWVRGTAVPRSVNRDRIASIWQLARTWSQLVDVQLGSGVLREVTEGRTLLDLLQDEHLRVSIIERALRDIARSEEPAVSGSRRGRRLAARFGKDLSSDVDDTLAIESGQRYSGEG